MHTLHLVTTESADLQTIRAVREAMRTLRNPEGTDLRDARAVSVAEANRAVEEVQRDGVALLGESDDLEFLSQVAAALEMNGCEAVIDWHDLIADELGRDPTPEEVFERAAPGEPAPEAEREVVGFSAESYETALALMAMSRGNPLDAAASAHTLGRTTCDDDLYEEVMNVLIRTFPWLAAPLQESGFITYDGDESA